MKVALIFIAAFTVAFADHHEMDPCLSRCRETMKTKLQTEPVLGNLSPEKLTSQEGRAKLREYLKNYIEGTGGPPAALTSTETLTKMCTLSTEAQTCINACPDSPKKEGVKKFMGLFKLACDADFKSSLPCLVEVRKQPSDTCKTKCAPVATKLKEYIARREANPTEQVHAPKDVLESGCKFINCRLNCRKTDIINKCQDKGFEQAKKFYSALAQTSKGLYKRVGGDLANWPDACKSDKIIEAHEY